MTAFLRHARTVSLLTLVSRVTGLVRDASLSRIFGAGGLTDAFYFAFLIPNLFRRLFGEGALAAAFLPAFTRLDEKDPLAAKRLASLTIATLLVGLGGVTIAGEVVLYFVSRASDHASLPVWLMMIMLPYMPLVCVVAILGAMLQAYGRFGPTAAAPIVLNGCVIVAAIGGGMMLGGDSDARVAHIGAVAGSVVIAGVLQVAWSLFALRGTGWFSREFAPARDAFRGVVRQALPMMLGLGVLQLNVLLDGVIASYPTVVGPTLFGLDYPLTEGAMASVSFAQRLYQFPLGVFGIAVATAIFPALARQAGDGAAFTATVRRGLRLVVFIGLPASAGLMLVRESLAAVILEGGDFGAKDTARVAFVLLGYAPAIWAYSMTHVLTRAFFARGDSTTPVKVAVAMVALNLTLNLTLIWTPLRESGLAWSTAACAIIQTIILSRLLTARVGRLADRAVTGSWGRTLAATVLMSAAVAIVAGLLPETGETERWRGSLLVLAALVTTGAVVYVTAALALRMPELRWALGRGDA